MALLFCSCIYYPIEGIKDEVYYKIMAMSYKLSHDVNLTLKQV